MSDSTALFYDLLRCPNCGGHVEKVRAGEIECAGCKTDFFSLGTTVCMFPAGRHQKTLWEHQAAVMQASGDHSLSYIQEAMSRYDLTSSTRQRLLDNHHALELSQNTTLALLRDVGIRAQFNEQMKHVDPGNLTEYWDLILQDWAWDRCLNSEYTANENTAARDRILSVAKSQPQPKKLLVLGAGAARLSWDLHCHLNPECTIALDSNPLMLSVAERLIKQQQPLVLGEFKKFPQLDRVSTIRWQVDPVADLEGHRHSWFSLAANAWRVPLQLHSFDMIITPWFIDVNGGDMRDTIALISRLLKPGGEWLNMGPLLFSRNLPLQLKYQASEIKEYIDLAGFTLEKERVDRVSCLASPLEVRRRYEQLWTFSATAPVVPGLAAPANAAWLIMHHLPVPRDAYIPLERNPVVDAILSLIDGQRSINDICRVLAPELPQGLPPKDVVVTLLGQILGRNERSA